MKSKPQFLITTESNDATTFQNLKGYIVLTAERVHIPVLISSPPSELHILSLTFESIRGVKRLTSAMWVTLTQFCTGKPFPLST